jgi:hypothetical protein
MIILYFFIRRMKKKLEIKRITIQTRKNKRSEEIKDQK